MLVILTPKLPMQLWAQEVLGPALSSNDDRLDPVGCGLTPHEDGPDIIRRNYERWFRSLLQRITQDGNQWPSLDFKPFCEWVDMGFSVTGCDHPETAHAAPAGTATQTCLFEWSNASNTARVVITRDLNGAFRVLLGKWFVDS